MKKYTKAAVATAVSALATIVEWAFSIDIPTPVVGAVTVLAVFLFPNIEE